MAIIEPILELQDLCFSYQEAPVLEHVSFSIYAGERIAVLGNNGAGKSTLFLCCNGVLRPTAGRLLHHGQPVTYRRADLTALRRHIGLVFQNPEEQIIAATVEAEVAFGPMNLQLQAGEVRRRVHNAMAACGLTDYYGRAPHYLSGGEKKRVSIADVLAMEPELLLFDEPTAGLDPENVRMLEENLDILHQRGLTLALCTHDVNFAWRWARRLLLFHAGRLVADGPPEEIFHDAKRLSLCGLEQPLLFRAARRLGLAQAPRTPEEFPQLIK